MSATDDHPPALPKRLLARIIIASLVGLAIAFVSVYVAWKGLADGLGLNGRQIYTQVDLEVIGRSIRMYHDQTGALPTTLQDLNTLHDTRVTATDDGKVVDGWGRPFDFKTDGTSFSVTSLGRDAKPGGVGLDCDMSITDNSAVATARSFPALSQFIFDMPTAGIIASCLVSGAMAFVLTFMLVQTPPATPKGIAAAGLKITLTAIGALIAAAIMAILHIPVGH